MVSARKLKCHITLLFSVLSVLLSDYNFAGVQAVFVFAPIAILVGQEFFLRKSVLKKIVAIDIIIILFTLPALINPWFVLNEFILSFVNVNLLILTAVVGYSAVVELEESALYLMKVLLWILIGLTFYQVIVYNLTGGYTQIQFGVLKPNVDFVSGHVFRSGIFRPFGVFTEAGHLALAIFAMQLCLLIMRNVNFALFLGSVIAMLLTFSLGGFVGAIILCICVFRSILKKELDKKFDYLIKITIIVIILALIFAALSGAKLVSSELSVQAIIDRVTAVFSGNDESASFRFVDGIIMVKSALKENFLTGAGLGQNTTMAESLGLGLSGRLNVLYFEILVYFGIIGFVALLGIFLVYYKNKKNGFVSFLFFVYLSVTQSGITFIYLYTLYTYMLAFETVASNNRENDNLEVKRYV